MTRYRKRPSTTRRVGWAPTMSEDVGPGDLLPWGVVREKTWGGPVGIHAWRIVVSDQHKPIWLKAKRTVICRRAAVPGETTAKVAGVVASSPMRSNDVPGRLRYFLSSRQARLRRAV